MDIDTYLETLLFSVLQAVKKCRPEVGRMKTQGFCKLLKCQTAKTKRVKDGYRFGFVRLDLGRRGLGDLNFGRGKS